MVNCQLMVVLEHVVGFISSMVIFGVILGLIVSERESNVSEVRSALRVIRPVLRFWTGWLKEIN